MNTELKELALKIMDSNMTDDTKVEVLFYMFSHKEKPYNPYDVVSKPYDPYNNPITWTCTTATSIYDGENIK